MSVTINIVAEWGKFEREDAEQVLAATSAFPYWAVWDKVGDDGKQTVTFISSKPVQVVSLTGESEADENGKPEFKVINLDDHRPQP